MLNMAIKGPLWCWAAGGITLSPSFWKVSETKISDKVSHVTPLFELNEMVQYVGEAMTKNGFYKWIIALACWRN